MDENRFIELAKHAIGMGQRKPYRRNGKLWYRPYRNYFATTVKSPDYEPWIEMADAGYAAFSQDGYRAFFWMKREGLDWLGEKLGIPLYLAAVVVFGTRLFQNFAEIRRELLTAQQKRAKIKQDLENPQ